MTLKLKAWIANIPWDPDIWDPGTWNLLLTGCWLLLLTLVETCTVEYYSSSSSHKNLLIRVTDNWFIEKLRRSWPFDPAPCDLLFGKFNLNAWIGFGVPSLYCKNKSTTVSFLGNGESTLCRLSWYLIIDVMNFLLHLFIMDLVTDCEVTVFLRSDLKLYLQS
jgi:hypothetical protein